MRHASDLWSFRHKVVEIAPEKGVMEPLFSLPEFGDSGLTFGKTERTIQEDIQYREELLRQHPLPEQRLDTILELVKLYVGVSEYHPAINRIEDGLKLCRRGKYQIQKSALWVWSAQIHIKWGNFSRALRQLHKAEQIQREKGDAEGMGIIETTIGLIYQKKGDWNNALEHYLMSEKILVKVNPGKGLGDLYNNMGALYDQKNEWDRALEYYLKSKDIHIHVRDYSGIGTIYNNIGQTYSNKREWDKGLEYLFKAEETCIERGERISMGSIYNNIGLIYNHKGDGKRALEYLFKSEKIHREIGNRPLLVTAFWNIGELYLRTGNKKKGRDYLSLAGYIAQKLGMKHELSHMKPALRPIREELGEEQCMEIGKRLYEKKGL